MRKKILSIILAVIILMNCTMFMPKTRAATFPDVADNHWANYYIYVAQYLNIINGYDDGTFKPENQVKTGEFIKMASKTLWPKYEYKGALEGDHWALPYAYTLSNGIININEYDFERLERPITRNEAVTIIGSLYIKMNSEIEIDFSEKYVKTYKDEESITDEKIRSAINVCTQFGIINGFEDGSFRGNETLTRAQAAKLIYTTIYN